MEEKLGESNKRWELFESYSRQIPPPKKSLLSALLFALGGLSDILQRLFLYLFIFFFSQHTVHGDTECNVPTSNVPSGLSFPRWRGDIVKFQIRFEPIRQRFVSCHHREARVLQLRDSEERGYRPIYTRFEG